MASLSKNVYIDKVDDIVNKYNNTYSTIKMKPFDVRCSTYADFKKKNNKEDPIFTVGDHVKISNYKNIFVKGYVPNWSKKVFLITKVNNAVPWIYVKSDLAEKMLECFRKKSCKNQIEENLEQKK